jgi:hypothetical protein
MSTELLTVLVVVPAYAVVIALFLVMWLAHRSRREGSVAIAAGIVLFAWAVLATVLARRGVFVQPPSRTAPAPVGINLLVAFAVMGASLAGSPSLRSLLSNQKHLIRLNVWRLVGFVFLLLMAFGQVPALWALPAGIGDVLVGMTAFWVAGQLDSPGGRRRAVFFNWFGVADLVVAIGLGMMTNVGPTQVFHTTPTSEILSRFPMALVPAFLVPLAFMLHIVSLWQFYAGSWRRDPVPRDLDHERRVRSARPTRA